MELRAVKLCVPLLALVLSFWAPFSARPQMIAREAAG